MFAELQMHIYRQELVEGYHAEYMKSKRFSDTDDAPIESPSARLWLEFFLAQHFDRIGETEKVHRCTLCLY